MIRHVLTARLLTILALGAGGCGGYGDEVDTGGGPPPLVQMKEVNAWLADYQQKFGTVPKTYEALKSAYEQTGREWPPFPPGGSWVYFPHQARVIEVREARVRAYLKHHSREITTSRYLHNRKSAAGSIRKHYGVSIEMPGYEITFVRKVGAAYFDIAMEEDGVTPVRGNHTATEDFRIDEENKIVAVPSKPESPY